MTTVLIIDDHPIVLQGCRRLLEDAGVETVLEARDPASGYRLYRRHHPDVRLVTLTGFGGTGKTRLSLEAAWMIEAIPQVNRSALIRWMSSRSDSPIALASRMGTTTAPA